MNKKKLHGLFVLLVSCAIGLTSVKSYAYNLWDSKTQPLPQYGITEIKGEKLYNARTFTDSIHQRYYNRLGFNKLWLNMYDDKYMAYNLTPPQQIQDKFYKNAKEKSKYENIFNNMANIYENSKNTFRDFEGLSFMGHTNLKVKSCPENDHGGRHLGAGHYTLTIPPYSDSPPISSSRYPKGKKVEWRFLGYTPGGSKIPNPVFPNDGFVEKPWSLIHWDSEVKYGRFVDQSEYDWNLRQKTEWARKYLLPEIRKTGVAVSDSDAAKWAKKFSLKSNPDVFTGIWQGTVGNNSGYMTVVTSPPAPPNLRLIEFDVYDNEGKLVGQFTRNANDSKNSNPSVNSKLAKNGNTKADIKNFQDIYMKAKVEPGETYRIVSKIKNMNPPEHLTKTTKLSEDWGICGSSAALEYNKYLTELPVGGTTNIKNLEDGSYSVQIINPKTHKTQNVSKETPIPAGATVVYTEDVKVPDTSYKYFKFGSCVPIGFHENGDNLNTDDDIAYLTFDVHDRNMKVEHVSVIDQEGKTVGPGQLIPGEPYKARFLIKYVGRDIKNPPNEVAIKDIQIQNVKDNGNSYIGATTWTIRHLSSEYDNKYKNNQFVLFETKDYFIPTEPRVYIKGRVSTKTMYNYDEFLTKNDNWGEGVVTPPNMITDLKPYIDTRHMNIACLNKNSMKSDIVVDLSVDYKTPFPEHNVSTKAIVQISGGGLEKPMSQIVDLGSIHSGLNSHVKQVIFPSQVITSLNENGQSYFNVKVILNPGIKTYETPKEEYLRNNIIERPYKLTVPCNIAQKMCEQEWLRNDWVQRFYIIINILLK